MDEKLYADLAAATKYYLIENEFNTRIQEESQNIKTLSEYMDQKKETFKKKGCSPILGGFGAVLIGINFFPQIIYIIITGAKPDSATINIMLLEGVFFTLSLLLIFIWRYRVKRFFKKCDKEFEAQIKPKIEKSQETIAELQTKLNAFIENNFETVTFLPQSYRNLQASSFMFLAVSNKRADTLKEAMNLYEEQLHRWKLEKYARQSVEIQEYCARAMDELNSKQAKTNEYLKNIEFMQFINY